MSNPLNKTYSTSGAAAAAAPDASAPLRTRFDIEKKLSESDAHSVYLARDRNNAGLVMLNVLSGTLAGDSRQVELFRLEASAAARLSHRNIPRSSQAEVINGVHFCVAEQRPDVKTLRDYLRLKGWLNAEEAVRICREIAAALEHAHGHGILHLTLDPEKVFIDPDGEVLITGFGIGRGKDLLWARQERSRLCAAQYITPEQILSGETDQRSDLYLLGIILFEMLTDRVPLESGDRALLRQKHLTRTPQPPHMFRHEISRELSRVVMDLLCKRPDGRPFTAGVLMAALDRCVASGLLAGEECADRPQIPDVAPVETAVAPVKADIMDEKPPEEDKEYSSEPDVAQIDGVIQAPLEEDVELEPGREIAAGPVFLLEESSKARPRRLVWVLIALILCGGILWAIRATGSQGEAAGTKASNPPVDLQSSYEPASSSAEVVLPTPGRTTARELSPASEPATPSIDVRVVNVRREGAAAIQAKPEGGATGIKSDPPRRPSISPPDLSIIRPALGNNAAAELNKGMPAYSPPHETAPAPEDTDKAETPAPKIIRKPGDVLQNSAVIRPRPDYPGAARAADIKGTVTVEVTIDEEGSVIAARPISGPQQLRDAAVDAARRWKWTPTRIGRNRARVVGTITFSFRD
jgi:serine/threonine-protein kinase